MVKKLGKNALENISLDTSCQIDLGSTVTAIDSSNYNDKILWGFNHDNPIQDDNTFRQQKSVVLDAIEADESTTTKSTFSFNYNNANSEKLILQKRFNNNNVISVMAADTGNGSSSSLANATVEQRKKITDIYIPYGISNIYNFCFLWTGIENINIPESVNSIGRGSFGCTRLKNITLPSSMTKLFLQAFYKCKELEYADLSKANITSLELTFDGCLMLNKVKLPDTLETIGAGTFKGCTALTEITIPSSVTTIADTAFAGCTNLKTITIKKSTDSIENAPWGATNVDEIIWEE